MSHDSITFVATIDIEKDQKFPNGRFNLANYKEEDFTKTHGDRWVRGYSRGGRLSARLIFTTSEEHDKEELKASAHAALRFWGISSDIDVEVKKAIEEVNKRTKVDVSLFQKGNLGKFRENKLIDKTALESVSASFAQLKEWADEFMEQACDHEFAFQCVSLPSSEIPKTQTLLGVEINTQNRPVLDEYTILPDFPQSQEIPDMDLLRLYANDLLHALVKASELSAALEREFETGGYPDFPEGRKGVRAMKKKFRGLVRESQKWTSQASIKVDSAEDDEEKVEDDIWAFIDHYKPLLQEAMAKTDMSHVVPLQ
ncbi:hypothetical protein CRV24_006380 [Beauveria bassiana]|nr:hypothetical protein CRV24_006380 [Beauveria bassiana]KAH8715456.1 hypothetical protein HC256_004275 [Beauveria bassiana]